MVLSKAKRSAAAKKAAQTRKRRSDAKKKRPKDPRKIAEEYYKNKICVWCGYPNQAVLQVAHVRKATPKNNNPSNLVWLCPTHHREYDLGLISRTMILDRRKYVESFPKADWNILFGLTDKEKSARAKKAWKSR